MVRSAAVVMAAIVLPGIVGAQESPRTHEVVTGDTLWDLAGAYYADPWSWRVIWNANREVVEDPHWIYPGEVLVIPGLPGSAVITEVDVTDPDALMPPPPPPVLRDPEHTVFYRSADASARFGLLDADANMLAVNRDGVYSAPWLIPLETEPERLGVLAGFADRDRITETARSYDRVLLRMDGGAPAIGTELRTYRIARTIEDVGEVVIPTGRLTVTDLGPNGPVAVVSKEYARIALGDFVGPLPTFPLRPGQTAEDVAGGTAAMVMGFATFAELHNLGSIAFLDVGRRQGIAIGDEFEYWNPSTGADVVEGRLQVVGLQDQVAAARVTAIDDDVFQQGVVVRLARKMRP